MLVIFFLYGLAFFCLGLVVLLEARRPSALALSRHLPSLAWFGLLHALVEWCDMLRLAGLPADAETPLVVIRSVLLPASAVFLVRFGVGLLSEAGPLPDWLMLAPMALVVPAALVVAYALIVALTEPPLALAADVWSRYLLYGPGCLLAAAGFGRQARRLPQFGLAPARPLLWGAAAAFVVNAVVAGLLVPAAPYGLSPWLNGNLALALTGLPVQLWRAASALAVTVLVIRAMGVFEAERLQHLARLSADREAAHQAAVLAQAEARRVAEAWTNTLVELNRRVAGLDTVDTVLPDLVRAAARLLAADAAALALWADDSSSLELKCSVLAGAPPAVTAQRLADDLLETVARRGRPCLLPAPEVPHWPCPVLGGPVAAACLVPVQLNGQALGVLWVSRAGGAPFGPADLTGLEHLADQTVIVLEHALMAARLQSLAVVEERGRIAREMHDGLSQVLGYLSLQTQTLEALVRRGDDVAALAELAQARAHIHEAQADVRENILSLRTTLAGQAGLLPALRQYVAEFEVQTGIAASLSSDFAGDPCLSPLAEAQLVRIAQEALANARKHAQARHVALRLNLTPQRLHLTVADDGRGFALEAVGQGHFGLHTMRERAESVGGGLTVDSGRGGTRLEAWLPRVVAN
ncbi:MAG: GAF domain-containing sensor histidine kinase [Anaerolineales bacterium]|nr:GAF domain-containing sensor histidine kinase [Anaerolineales bacterium]